MLTSQLCKVNINIHIIFHWSQASIWCIDFHDRLTSSLEIKKIVKKEKKEITPKISKNEKKVKDTILRYSHIGIYVKIPAFNH